MKRLFLSLMAACMVVQVAPVRAQGTYCFSHDLPEKFQTDAFFSPIQFRVVNISGQRILIAEGSYDEGSGERFIQNFQAAGAIDEVWINSPGGSVDDGLIMGRALRRFGVMVRIPAQFACISSCTLAFLGGPIRAVDNGAYYGVHMFSSYSFGSSEGDQSALTIMGRIAELELKRRRLSAAAKTAAQRQEINAQAAQDFVLYQRSIEEQTAKASRALAQYVVEMSASMNFFDDMYDQPQVSECYLSRAGLQRYNVVNSR